MGDPRSRRYRLGTGLLAALSAAALVAACTAPNSGGGAGASASSSSDVPDKPAAPVTLNVIDVAGNLQLTQPMFDDFVKQHPDIISKVNTSTAKAPDLPGKLQAQEQGGSLAIDLVLTGTDALGSGIAGGLYQDLTPYLSRISNMQNYDTVPAKMQQQAKNQGVELVWYPSGPLLEYDPAKVTNPPTTADELLAWCKANPGKFLYAQPANSGPGTLRQARQARCYRAHSAVSHKHRLGQDLEVPAGPRRMRADLRDRYDQHDEEAGQRVGVDGRQHHRVGHQRPRHQDGAEHHEDHHDEGLPLGQ